MWWILWVFLGLTVVFLYGELLALVGEAKIYSLFLSTRELDVFEVFEIIDAMYDDETLMRSIRNKIVKFYIEVWMWSWNRDEKGQ